MQNVSSPFLAHISEDGLRTQTVAEHLQGTAALCSRFAAAFDAAEYGNLAGLLHDIGKYSTAFQNRLHGGPRVDHSTAGAQEALKRRWPELAFAVAGHHSGLPDGGTPLDLPQQSTLMGRNKKKDLAPYQSWQQEITLPPLAVRRCLSGPYSQSFFIRMLYSCLVDADYLDTETFMNGAPAPRGQYDDIKTLLGRLQAYTAAWQNPKTGLNKRRCDILNHCYAAGHTENRGLFTLTVPTGGGKTAASLAFALSQADAHKMDRIIYVIPYTSIIDQTAATFSKILGAGNVLEHHSGMDYSAAEDIDPAAYRKALAAENWDAPVIVTTTVQFFESLYASHPAKCRKLHNIANSVIIFDEVQNLPDAYLRPCVAAIAELVQNYHATAVLCTATQPSLPAIFKEFAPNLFPRELCPEPDKQYLAFQRTTLVQGGELSLAQLQEQLCIQPQVLCIVNRRKTAQDLFQALPQEGSYCLTTLLYPAHRKRLLQEIRSRLSAGQPCRVVSTSLIEAGVDVDFPSVYREKAGLASILQSAGRCNREGKRSAAESPVTIFSLKDQPIPDILHLDTSATDRILQTFPDPASPQAIEAYFSKRRMLKGSSSFDSQNILDGIAHGMENRLLPFAIVAERFRLIESPTQTVYVPLEGGQALTDQLLAGYYSKGLFRRLGQYGVPVYPEHLKALQAACAVKQVENGLWILTDLRCYNSQTGLSMDIETGQALFY